MAKFIITESEKNEIRKMYGLIFEDNENLPSLPYSVKGSWSAPDCDALHAFQSRKEDGKDENGKPKKVSVVYGDMSAKVTEALAIFWNKIPAKVTNVEVSVSGMKVDYTVTIDKSQNNIGMNGFTTKGAGCGDLNNSGLSPDKFKEYMKKRATEETGKSQAEIKANIAAQSNVGKLNYFEEITSFYDPNLPDGYKIYQVFYQYQTQNPPQVKSQETEKKEKNLQNQNTNNQSQITPSTTTKPEQTNTKVDSSTTTKPEQTNTKVDSSTTSKPEQKTSEKNYSYQYPNDKNYRYAVLNNQWWAKNIKNNKEFELTGNDYKDKFQVSINNLDKQFPDARPDGSPHKEV